MRQENSKGIALPMEMIVIIAVVVLVLVVIIAFFLRGAGPSTCSIAAQAALASGCTDLVTRYNCDAAKVGEVNIVAQGACEDLSTLEKACRASGYTDNALCAQTACRCP